MKKYLRLTLFTSIMFYLSVVAYSVDTLNVNKNNVYLSFKYGLPAINSLKLYSGITFDGFYNVKSRNKSCYEFFIIDNYKKNNYSLGLSLFQSEFRGNDFKIYNYNIYQKIKYNVFYGSLGFGRNYKFGRKHFITPSVYLYFPLLYDIKINNVYSVNNAKDTTLIPATKNAYNDSNFGHFPNLKIGATYGFSILNRLKVNFDLSAIYLISLGAKIPTFNPATTLGNSSNYSFMGYIISQQFIILPTIGVTFKLNNE